MLLYILAGVGFWNLAKAKELNSILWAVIAIAATLVGQFIGGFFMGLTSPQLLSNYGALWLVAISSSLLALAIVWLAMNAVAKKKKLEADEFSDVLDDEYLEKL